MRHAPAILAVLLLVGATPARAGDLAEEEYQAARKAYYALKEDAQRRNFRHNWQSVAGRFEAVARKHPKSARAADALFTAARLQRELSRISVLEEDLRQAIANYQRLIVDHPGSSLADDAALELAQLYVERTGEPHEARRVVEQALKTLPRGDMRGQLVALKATLPEVPAPAPTGKKVAKAAPPAARSEPARPSAAAAKSERATATSAAAATLEPARTPAAEEALAVRPWPGAGEDEVTRPPLLEAIARAAAEPGPLSAPDPAEARERMLPAVQNPAADVTLAEQLGLKVRRVVIDAGHGGHDTGAIGAKGTREKDVTLSVARRVGEILTEAGLEVILTRDDDTYVRLEDRTRIANEAKGDLFLSIHCNAAESRKVRGVETFTLNVASDRYSIRLAARENAASEQSMSDLQFILADLATKANTEESERLARRVQGAIVGDLAPKYPGVVDLGTKQALFYVLLGAKMPAILVETSFLSHAEEEKRLASKAYQEALAQAVARGVQGFLEDRQRMAQVH